VLFAVAIWRSGRFSKLAAVPMALATAMMCLPTVYAVEIAGCALFAFAGAAIAFSSRSRAAHDAVLAI
jgi:hypothetical protein